MALDRDDNYRFGDLVMPLAQIAATRRDWIHSNTSLDLDRTTRSS